MLLITVLTNRNKRPNYGWSKSTCDDKTKKLC